MQPLVVFSHLRWDFVYQRPQQLMTRLARDYGVCFVEEPVYHSGPAYMDISSPVAGVRVCRPYTSVASPGFHDDQLPLLQELLEELIIEHNLVDPIAWLYTPMALPLVQRLRPCALVYDCMDELSAFLHAPRQLVQRERALLKVADAVFTGGRSLYRAKKPRNDAVYCFPSSVEAAHFAQAKDPAIEHADQLSLAHPRLGFYGVIDERLDLSLIGLIAREHPEWQIVMVGPVVKIDPLTLPLHPNIHYFGQRSYAELPRFVAGWDVCLMPFALNGSTRFISPTKTLEYMAAEKAIVSTRIPDVLESYADVVYSGTNDEAFVFACERALHMHSEASDRIARMREIVAATSWDTTAAAMRSILQTLAAPACEEPAQPTFETVAAPGMRRAIVIGAGPTGLSAAYHLGEEALLLEQNDSVGGWCRSIQDRGFTFDYAGHIMFSKDPYVQELYQLLLGSNVHWQDREAWIYSSEVYTRYPFQGALYGLPPDVLKDCLVGAIEARFGPIGDEGASTPTLSLTVSSHNTSSSLCKADSITDCCADGSVQESAAEARFSARSPSPPARARNFEQFIYSVWGSGVAQHFALPYNRKLWAVPLTEMETSWLGGRVPLPNLTEMIEGALRPVAKPMGPNARFGYPLKGGFQALVEGFLPHLRGELKLNARVTRITPSEHEVTLADGSTYRYEQLISTMPLPVLIRLIGDEAPPRIRVAAAALRHVSVRCVNLGIGRPKVTDKHWIYYPGDSVFHRIFVQGNASEHVNAHGGFGLTCEITYSAHKPLPSEGDELIDLCIADCIRVGLLREDDQIIARNQVDMPYAYVVYDHARADNVEVIRRWLGLQDIHLAGRYGEWEYYNSDHAFLAGRKAAEIVGAALGERANSADLAGTPSSRSQTVST
jgi:UDP-galactopyranose mutase